jgi:catechol 2,3-dioxygenase-like lactoylglutathione lyase family enzyme
MSASNLIHHLGVFAADFAASERFYTAALEALGVRAGVSDRLDRGVLDPRG